MDVSTDKQKKFNKALTLDEVFSQVTSTLTTTPGYQNKLLLTPTSSEACLRHGINPDHLRKRSFETFYENGQSDLDIQRLKYETYEYRRHELMEIASKEKERILRKQSGCDKSVSISTVASLTPSAVLREQEKANSTLIEMEEKRLRKAKEKQKRELLQMLQFEQKMERIQEETREKAKQEALEEERKRALKLKQDRQAAEERRLRELRKKAKEEAEEEMQRLNARQRCERERQFELEKEQRILENKERLRKLEEEREKKRELQQLEAERQQEQKRRDIEMRAEEREKREQERQMRIEKKREADQHELNQKRKQAADRIALNKEVARRKEEERKKAVIDKRKRNDEQQQQITMSREQERELARQEREALARKREYQAKLAKEREEEMKASLLKKFNDSEEKINEMKHLQEKDMVLIKEERDINMQLKRENVERIKRMQEYKRLETVKKIADNDQRTEEMLKRKEELAKARRQNAIEAKIRRDRLMQTLEKSKVSGGKAIKKILDELSADEDHTASKQSPKPKQKKHQPVLPKKTTIPPNKDKKQSKTDRHVDGSPPSVINISSQR
eukprot:CAMPEP_0176506236 /NCGR_PEP_ID=MMETSP0200_2-20121128/16925_1 /TAXON_ID=947934 /ORGANISM="Chaetoceros sp., Strain GSL56" /LENGTH=564 /DNA_ID=CAMNT_0017905853 /DNA_START=899 /DNA_END=2589 /DNA_ORIENTATION=-